MLMKIKLRWAGHLVRMDDERLPKQIFYGQLKECKRNPGGQIMRYKDSLRVTLQRCQIDIGCWEELCMNRASWRKLIHDSVETFEQERQSQLIKKRHNRKNRDEVLNSALQANATVFPCTICDKICLSRIGLVGHMRVHRRDA